MKIQIIETKGKVLGGKHSNILFSIANFALMYLNQKQYKKTKKLEMQVIEMRKKLLKAEHLFMLTTMANFVPMYYIKE